MKLRRYAVAALAILWAGLPVGRASSSTAAGESSTVTEFRSYVALGDSYTAGPLIPTQRYNDCLQSWSNYPNFLADKLGVRDYEAGFVDVSCSAATTDHMTTTQYGPTGYAVPPQFEELTSATDLVTVGIGGNDEGLFGTLVGTCPGERSKDPSGAPCRDKFTVDGVDTMSDRIPRIAANVAGVLDGIHERSPKAAIAVVGYLRLGPESGTCAALPFATGDYAWLDGIEAHLNAALAEVAERDGALFVDAYAASRGHDACSAEPWVQGQWHDLSKGASYHPNAAGMKAVANLAYRALQGENLALGSAVTASPGGEWNLPARHAVDGHPKSRWGSAWQDGQWITVDLGSTRSVSRVVLSWEAAYARAYRIQTSVDGSTWTTAWSTTSGDGKRDEIRFAPASARYVRMLGGQRATSWGYSLFEFEVYRR